MDEMFCGLLEGLAEVRTVGPAEGFLLGVQKTHHSESSWDRAPGRHRSRGRPGAGCRRPGHSLHVFLGMSCPPWASVCHIDSRVGQVMYCQSRDPSSL